MEKQFIKEQQKTIIAQCRKLARVIEKSKRGGRRSGAGRKVSGNVSLTIRIKPRTAQALKSDAKRRGITIGELVDTWDDTGIRLS